MHMFLCDICSELENLFLQFGSLGHLFQVLELSLASRFT